MQKYETNKWLQFCDLDSFSSNLKSSQCYIYDETKIMRLFGGVCGGSKGVGPMQGLALAVYTCVYV